MSEVVPKFGWIPPDERTREQEIANAEAVAKMPKFKIVGKTDYGEGKVFLTDLWKHPDVVSALGYEFPGIRQVTGSCVGCGGGNALFTLIAADAITRGEPEKIVIPFWQIAYGRSRFYMGDTSPGEGSLGGTFAQAVREDGTLDAQQEGLPEFDKSDGLCWGEECELSWSDGDAQQTLELLPLSREHLVKTTAECHSADDVREAICNGYPVTLASNWGGLMECEITGNPPVLLNRRATSWAHQMSGENWWDHPSLKEIFWIHNQWGKRAHGIDPAGGPAGGFWITAKEMDSICRNGEVFAFSQFAGFPAQKIPWDGSRF
jgi:hypothetical protein